MKWIEIQILKLRSLIQKDNIIYAIDIKNKVSITFKNGRITKIFPLNNSEFVRGKRSKLPLFYDDFECDPKIVEEVLKKFTKAGVKVKKIDSQDDLQNKDWILLSKDNKGIIKFKTKEFKGED